MLLLPPLRFEIVLNCSFFHTLQVLVKFCFLKQSRSKIPTHSCSFQLKHVYSLFLFCLGKSAFLCPLFPSQLFQSLSPQTSGQLLKPACWLHLISSGIFQLFPFFNFFLNSSPVLFHLLSQCLCLPFLLWVSHILVCYEFFSF